MTQISKIRAFICSLYYICSDALRKIKMIRHFFKIQRLKKLGVVFFVFFMANGLVQAQDKTFTQQIEKADQALLAHNNALAISTLSKIIQQLELTPDDSLLITQTLIQARMKIILAYQRLGFMDKALKDLDKNLLLLEKGISHELAVQLLSQASDTMLSVGDLGSSRDYLQQAIKLSNKNMRPAVLAALWQRAGNTYTALGQFEKAVNYYDKSIQYAQKSSQLNLEIKSKVNRLFPVLQLNSDRQGTVLSELESVAAFIPRLDQVRLKSSAHITLGVLAYEQLTETFGQLTQLSYKNLYSAYQLSQQTDDHKQQSVSAGYLAKLYFKQKRYNDALVWLNRAIFYAQLQEMPEYLYQWYELKGQISLKQGQNEEALLAFNKAVKILSPIRNHLDIGVRSPIRSFNDAVKSVYYSLADLLLQKAQNTSNKAQQQKLLYQARDTIESLKVAELENYFQDDCVANLQASQKQLETISPGIIVLYPISLPNRLVLLVSSSGTIKQYNIPVTADFLKDQALLFRKNLQSRPHNRFLSQAKQLYTWMIKPIKKDLEQWQVDTLVIVADGLLRTIPFSSLYDGNQFLIEQYALVNAPGFKLIDPKPLEWKNNKVLLAGLSEGVQDFSPLPNVPKELRKIESILSNKQLIGDKIINQQYTLEQMQSKLANNNYSIVHMATHAQFTGQHNNDFLLTYDNKLTIDKLKNLIGFGRFRDKPIELLTMSACQTALGDERAALGLAGVAIKAGARSALATLWFVDDEATSLAVTEFYQALAGKKTDNKPLSKAKALQLIQKDMIGQARYWHPSYWAPFLLIGNWL